MFNSLRHSGAFPGDLVAVQGIGGLGHLGIQFAQKLGYRVAAIGRGLRMSRSQESSERASTSTANRQIQRRCCKSSAARKVVCYSSEFKGNVRTIRRPRTEWEASWWIGALSIPLR